ncbi:MAG: fibrobacter succinogenes major paralogous domain-containing protein [Bacteroidales bacterium]|nr:fibrobacter succinogenes major paralogous domain-containing protein [Bacteroidales bacterium]
MKKLFILFTTGLLATVMLAQAPQKMSYQAVVRNASGALVTGHDIGMKISILQGSPTGNLIYQEIYKPNPQTNENGLLSLEIGEGIPLTGTFASINWSKGPYYLMTETDPSGETNYTITGTSQLLSVPYALHAKTAETLSETVPETQNLADVIAINNSALGQIKDLTDPTEAQDAVTKTYVDKLESQIVELQLIAGVKVKDIDGNVYNTITIGTQIWLVENLKTTRYNDGTNIPLIENNTEWGNLTTPGYCWYNNDEATYKNTYGALYNWYTVNTDNLCLSGWHVASDSDWSVLSNFLGGTDIAGGKLKEVGTEHWTTPNTGANNETGFTALPAGYRTLSGTFNNIQDYGYYWSSTAFSTTHAWYVALSFHSSVLTRVNNYKRYGFSVRCIKD